MNVLERRPLGRTGLDVPVIGLGTWALCGGAYGRPPGQEAHAALARALEIGCTLFDMAPSWGDGRAESAVAKAVGDRRDDALYVTRAGRHRSAAPGTNFGKQAIVDSVEASLARLATDRIDVLLLHNPSREILEERSPVEACEAMLNEGKVRAWGASVASLEAARAALEQGAQVLCLPHNLLRSELLWTLESELLSREVGVLASSPLAHGLLAGRWSDNKGFASSDHRTRRWHRDALAARMVDVRQLRAELIDANPQGSAKLSDAAIGFVLAEPAVSAALTGARSVSQLEALVRNIAEPPYFDTEQAARLRRNAGF